MNATDLKRIALYPRGKDPEYPLNRRLDGPQGWFGHRGFPVAYPVGTGVLPGGYAQPGRDADHLPHLMPSSIMSRSYILLSSLAPAWHSGTGFTFTTCWHFLHS
jgi:hypothetical protein